MKRLLSVLLTGAIISPCALRRVERRRARFLRRPRLFGGERPSFFRRARSGIAASTSSRC
jgi:hypothetical protein